MRAAASTPRERRASKGDLCRLTAYSAVNRQNTPFAAVVRRAALTGTALLAAIAPAAFGQGGVTAPDFSEPCPAVYPGDEAGRERLARWMARGAADRGLPHELPVMAGIAESGLRNVQGSSYHGFFGMHESLNAGAYRGFPRNPELQLRWFLDTAEIVRQRRLAEARPDPAATPGSFGEWIADVERPAAENRDGYQPHLEEARRLVAGRCNAPAASDTTPPRLVARIARTQRPRAPGGITLRVRCPDGDCLAGATATVPAAGNRSQRVLRALAVEPPARGFATLVIRLPRATRRALAAGDEVRTRVTALAADLSGNVAKRGRVVTLTR